MTIKELCELIPEDHQIKLAVGGNNFDFAHNDPFQLDAFGDYEIQTVFAVKENKLELEIKMHPVRRSN